MSDQSSVRRPEDLTLADLEELSDEEIEDATGARPPEDAWDVVTPPEVLAELAKAGFVYVREAVAGNPSTAQGTLERLSSDSSSAVRAAVASNSSLAERTIRHLATDTVPAVRAKAAGVASAPTDVLSALAIDPSSAVRAAVAGNPAAPRECLKQLLSEHDESILRALRSNRNAPPELRDAALTRLVTLDDEDTLIELAKSHDADEALLRGLSESKHTTVRAQVAAHRRTPVETLERLSEDDMWYVLYRVATNRSTPAPLRETLARLVIKEDPFSSPDSVASFAALARTTDSPEILHRILQRKDHSVWEVGTLTEIASNPNATEEILEAVASKLILIGSRSARIALARLPALENAAAQHLVNDDLDVVRRTLAQTLTRSFQAMEQLARDPSPSVRREIAQNPNVPTDVLEALARDREWSVLVRLARNKSSTPEVLKTLAARKYRRVMKELSLRSDLPVDLADEVLQSLNGHQDNGASRKTEAVEGPHAAFPSQHGYSQADPECLSHITPMDQARSRHTTEALMLQLVEHHDTWVRMTLAGNPAAPCSVLSVLARDPESIVRSEVASHREAKKCGLIEELVADDHEAVRSAIAARLDLPMALLRELARDRRARVRRTAAGNSRLPREILQELTHDRSREVAQAAKEALGKRK